MHRLCIHFIHATAVMIRFQRGSLKWVWTEGINANTARFYRFDLEWSICPLPRAVFSVGDGMSVPRWGPEASALRLTLLITSLLENEPGFCHLFLSRPPSTPPHPSAPHIDLPQLHTQMHLIENQTCTCVRTHSRTVAMSLFGRQLYLRFWTPSVRRLLRVHESVCTCARSASCSWADNTYPLLQGPGREGGEATAGSQWAKPTRRCQGARQTKMAAQPVLVHLTDKLTATVHIWWIQRAAFPEID